MWQRLLLAAALAWAILPAGAADPGADALLAVPPLARVTDSAGALSARDRAALDGRLAAFEGKQGSQIAILVVPSTRPEPIEDFAHRVGDAWKIGRKGIGDGVLVVVAVKDREVRIDVARNLEGAIPDVVAARIIRERMIPRFAAGDIAGGLNSALDALFARIVSEGLAPGPGEAPGAGTGVRPVSGPSGLDEGGLRRVLGLLLGAVIVGSVLRRMIGVLGSVLAAGGAAAAVGLLFSSVALGLVAAVVVFVLSLPGAPLMIATQVLGGRGGFPGGTGGGGFRSGGGGDFSGGGASGRW
jgi:uncharacterized protein